MVPKHINSGHGTSRHVDLSSEAIGKTAPCVMGLHGIPLYSVVLEIDTYMHLLPFHFFRGLSLSLLPVLGRPTRAS